MIPSTKADMDAETAPKLLRLIDMLEDCRAMFRKSTITVGSPDEVAATCNGAVSAGGRGV